MSRAPGVGTHARSRELGYSDAMSEIGALLRAEAQRWVKGAEREEPLIAAAFALAAGKLQEVARYAQAATDLYVDHRSPLEESSLVQLDWRLRGDAPRELPAGRTS